jgi:hypothetical protein
MRSQVQVLAGPPAKALPERPPATPLDHSGPLGPAPTPTASVLAPPVRPPRGPHGGRASRLGRLLQDHSAPTSAAAAGRASAGRGPGWLIGRVHQTGPGLASQAQRRRRRNPSTARSTQPTSTTVTKTTQIGSSGGIARPLTKWSLLGEILAERPSGGGQLRSTSRPLGDLPAASVVPMTRRARAPVTLAAAARRPRDTQPPRTTPAPTIQPRIAGWASRAGPGRPAGTRRAGGRGCRRPLSQSGCSRGPERADHAGTPAGRRTT